MVKIILYIICAIVWAILSGMHLGRFILRDSDKKSSLVIFIMYLLLSLAYAGLSIGYIYKL